MLCLINTRTVQCERQKSNKLLNKAFASPSESVMLLGLDPEKERHFFPESMAYGVITYVGPVAA